MNKIKVIALCVFGTGILIAVLMHQYGKLKEWAVKQAAIENPAKTEVITKVEYRDKIIYRDREVVRVKIKYPDGTEITREETKDKGKTIEAVSNTVTTNTVSKPVVPETKISHKSFYLSGGLGSDLKFENLSYSIGAGILPADCISVGIRGQNDGKIFAELAVYF